jgi:DNA replication and repair protein RecF
MARHGVAATAARASVIAQLNAAPAEGEFPAARLGLLCPIAAQLQTHPALDTEDWLRASLRDGRAVDAAAGSARIGAHRADLAIGDAATGLPAAQASTGQQKSLLLGIVLGHAQLLGRNRGFAPLLLLDEPLVHLDATRRAALFDTLARLPAQSFLTGTDAALFAPLEELADGFTVSAGGVRPWPNGAGSAINTV